MLQDKLSQIPRKAVIAFITTCILSLMLTYVWLSPIVTIGNVSVPTCDAYSIHRFQVKVAKLSGAPVPSFHDTVQYLSLSLMQREILASKHISINSSLVKKLVLDESPYRGMLNRTLASIGDESFTRYISDPVAVAKVFTTYYFAQDPVKHQAESALAAARTQSLDAIASTNHLKVESTTIAASIPANSEFYAAARSVGAGAVINQIINDPSNYFVARVDSVDERSASISAIRFQRTHPGKFILSQLQEAQIAVSTAFWSTWTLNDITPEQ